MPVSDNRLPSINQAAGSCLSCKSNAQYYKGGFFCKKCKNKFEKIVLSATTIVCPNKGSCPPEDRCDFCFAEILYLQRIKATDVQGFRHDSTHLSEREEGSELNPTTSNLRDTAASTPQIYARNMFREEIDAVYTLCRSNYIFSLTKDLMSSTHECTPSSLMVLISSTEGILCFCAVYEAYGNYWISGFAVRRAENMALIQTNLFTDVCVQISNNNPVEVIVPATMRGYFRLHRYVLRWDIHLYSADISNLVLPNSNTSGYVFSEIEGSYGFSFPLQFNSADGNEKTIFLQIRPDIPEVSFTIAVQNGKITGFGSLHKHLETEWLIAPLYASEENEVKIILNALISYIRRSQESATVRMYLIRCSAERSRWLEEARFEKCPPVWSRYSPPGSDNRLVNDIMYDDAERFVFALGSIIYCEF